MTAHRTERGRFVAAPLVACAVCAIVGAVLCVAAARGDGFLFVLDVGRLARRPAPAATLIFGLSGLLLASRGRPGRPRGPSPKNGLNRAGGARHCEGSADRR